MRNFFSTALLCSLLGTSTISCSAAPKVASPALPIVLAQNSSSKYVISLANDAIPAEKTAARELQSYFAQITGAQLPIKNESEVPASTPQVFIGAGKKVKSLFSKQNFAALKPDSIFIKTAGNNLVLAGSRPRGTLYAVYEFLEKNAGVRWWTAKESTVPKRADFRIGKQDTLYAPPFFYREHFTRDVIYKESLFATRMRENGHFQTQDESLGGHYSLIGWCHTFDKLLPPAKYFKDHPEWYSDPSNGNKPCTKSSPMPGPQASQLNLTNEEARKELTKNALALLRENPSAGIISITQNDNYNYCKSEGDLAVIEREGSPAGPLLEFVNKVAADIEKEFPNFLVETLAYSHTRKPPKTVKPRKNVIIRLCSIEADFARPLDSDANQSFRDDMTGWKKIASHLYVWDYMTNFANSIWPHPNLYVLGPNMRYFARNGVDSVYMQGDAYSNGTGDFVQLRTWLVSRLLWNPNQDEKKLIQEFLRGYYGPAAPHLYSYLDRIQSSFLANKGRLPTANFDSNYLSLDVVSGSWADFQAAQKAVANNPVLSRRVRRERLVLDNVIISRYGQLKRNIALREFEGTIGQRAAFLPNDLAAFTNEFIKTAYEYKVLEYKEGVHFREYEKLLKARIAEPVTPLPVELRESTAEAARQGGVIDVQEDQLRYFYGPTVADAVPDALATNGKAARLTGNTGGWALQYQLEDSRESLVKSPWHIYAVASVEMAPGAAPTGKAFSVGVHDEQLKRGRHSLDINVDGLLADGKYHLVDLGKTQLDSGCYFYIAPPERADVKAIYVDRVLFVRAAAFSVNQLPVQLRQTLAADVKAGNVVNIQEDQFEYFYGSEVARAENDKAASNGRAGYMVGNTETWAIQYAIPEKQPTPTRVYAVVRVAAKPGATLSGPAFAVGVFNRKNPKNLLLVSKELSADLTNDKYQVVDLGVATLNSDSYFYLSGPKRVDIDGIYLDRLILVRNPG